MPDDGWDTALERLGDRIVLRSLLAQPAPRRVSRWIRQYDVAGIQTLSIPDDNEAAARADPCGRQGIGVSISMAMARTLRILIDNRPPQNHTRGPLGKLRHHSAQTVRLLNRSGCRRPRPLIR